MIEGMDYRRYRRTFRKPLLTARGEWKVREGFIVRFIEDGQVRYGEVAPLPESGSETVERAEKFLRQWTEDPIFMPSGLPCCCFALTAGVAESAALRDYSVAALLPAGENALEVAHRKLAEGYRVFKWKIGTLPVAEELALCGELLQGIGPAAKLRLDANAGLTADDLEVWLKYLQPNAQQVDFIEQPLPPGEESRMAALSQDVGLPIALDESLNVAGGGQWLLPGAWCGPLVIKPLLMGLAAPLLEHLRPLAQQLVYSSVFETGVGLRHALAVADVLPPTDYAIGFDTLDAFDDGLTPIDSGPFLKAEQRVAIDLEGIWNQLPHSK